MTEPSRCGIIELYQINKYKLGLWTVLRPKHNMRYLDTQQ